MDFSSSSSSSSSSSPQAKAGEEGVVTTTCRGGGGRADIGIGEEEGTLLLLLRLLQGQHWRLRLLRLRSRKQLLFPLWLLPSL